MTLTIDAAEKQEFAQAMRHLKELPQEKKQFALGFVLSLQADVKLDQAPKPQAESA